jgi:hypothetical protein
VFALTHVSSYFITPLSFVSPVMFPFSSICNPFFDSVSISVLCAAFCESTIPLFIAIPVSPTAFPSESTFLTSTVNLTGFITLTKIVSTPSFVVITGLSTYE